MIFFQNLNNKRNMDKQFEVYNCTEFIPTTFSCTKCNNSISVSISTHCTDNLLNEISKTLLCVNCNNNIVDQQNMMCYINEQINYMTQKNFLSFQKINSKIITLGNNISKVNINKEHEVIDKKIKDTNNKIEDIDKKLDNIDKKNLLNNILVTNLIKKSQNEIISLNIYVDKNDNSISSLLSKYDSIIECKKDFIQKISNEIQGCINICDFNKKSMERLNTIVRVIQSRISDNLNKYEKYIDTKLNTYQDEYKIKYDNLDNIVKKYYTLCLDLEDKYKKTDNEVKTNFRKLKNDFEEKYKDLDENIKSYYMKNKELKELKKSLILNDKEYKSFKNHIKKINTNLIYFYSFIGINILFFLFSIYTFLR